MKLKDIKINSKVFIKKSILISGIENTVPYIVKSIYRKRKQLIVELSNGLKLNPGQLSEKSCYEMTCKNCIYHHHL